MNMMLLSPGEIGSPIPRSDDRVRHILKILKKRKGEDVLAGVLDGRIGRARIESLDGAGAVFSFSEEGLAEPPRNIVLLLGLPRPIQANRILKDIATLGVRRIILCSTDLGEASYARAGFYEERGWERALREGASQAANPRLPEVSIHGSIGAGFEALDGSAEGALRVALDIGESLPRLSSLAFGAEKGAILAVGSERGWSDGERSLLSASGFISASLGSRVLRTETAAIVGAGICLASMGVM
jgi:16S rRNA (uracil1498-N3)-methyltransferase